MAESHKDAASTSKLKDKTSLLDEDIGKEFLSLLKSMSMTDDDPMNFNFANFATDTKVKKKTFNFDKLDVYFNLDADFKKISSFKMDMADLDFSTPLEKTGKAKETSGDKPQNGNQQQEKEHFAFSFDFNEEKKCNDIDVEGATSVNTDNQGSSVHQMEGNIAREDGGSAKLPVPENAALSKFESSGSGGGDIWSESVMNASISDKAENMVVSEEVQCSEEKLDGDAQEKGQSVSGSEPNQCAVSESNTEVCSVTTDVNASSGEEQNINLETPAVISNVENSGLRTSSTHSTKALSNNSERKNLGKHEHHPAGITNGINVSNRDSALEDSLLRSPSGKMLHDPNAVIKEQSSSSKPLLTSLNREGFDASHEQSQSKLVATGSISLLAAEPTKGNPVLRGSEKKVNGLKGFGERCNLGDTYQQSMLAETSHLKVNEIEEDRHLGTEKNIKDNTSRNAVPKSGLLKFTPLGGSFTLKRSEEKILEDTDSKIVPTVVKEKQMTQIPPLKRKTYEVILCCGSSDVVSLKFAATAILVLPLTLLDSHASPENSHPPKRLSPTPNENWNSKEAFQRISEEQICDNKNLAKGNDNIALDDYQSSVLSAPWETSLKELEVPLTIENDGNVEKAESCTKELEDICIMLKKKHEEAKELLVRAIVNNNNLLILNHPIYEEKISFSFFSLLCSAFLCSLTLP
ncbi:hypothetical protein RJ641_018406 [Dillenia turbinata]|uniref:Uncharacterized protein n=1 Tax=Dillenia turbinata TaxID=194707 RepID=A0AAN8YZ92_9MAGN